MLKISVKFENLNNFMTLKILQDIANVAFAEIRMRKSIVMAARKAGQNNMLFLPPHFECIKNWSSSAADLPIILNSFQITRFGLFLPIWEDFLFSKTDRDLHWLIVANKNDYRNLSTALSSFVVTKIEKNWNFLRNIFNSFQSCGCAGSH